MAPNLYSIDFSANTQGCKFPVQTDVLQHPSDLLTKCDSEEKGDSPALKSAESLGQTEEFGENSSVPGLNSYKFPKPRVYVKNS